MTARVTDAGTPLSRFNKRQLNAIDDAAGGSERRELALTTSSGCVKHRKRPTVVQSYGVHATWKLVKGVPSMRQGFVLPILEACLRAGKRRFGLNLLGYSIMSNHLHVIVGPSGDEDLRRGMQGLGVRLAKALNKLFGRKGKFFAERFHARPLMTRSSVRYAVRYALQNARKHGIAIPKGCWDRYSSAHYFRPGSNAGIRVSQEESPVVYADSFLYPWIHVALKQLGPDEVPGPRFTA